MKPFNIINLKSLNSTASALLLVCGICLAFSSCTPNILRDGNQPVAAIIALVGIFALINGVVALREFSHLGTTLKYVLISIFLEVLVFVSIVSLKLIVDARKTFFLKAPLGGDMLGTQKWILIVLGGVFVSTVAIRVVTGCNQARRPQLPNLKLNTFSAAWGIFALAIATFIILNLAPRSEDIQITPKTHLVIESYGMPAVAARYIYVEQTPLSRDAQFPADDNTAKTIQTDNGTKVTSDGERAKVVFNDGTVIDTDLANKSAELYNKSPRVHNTEAAITDAVCVLLIPIYITMCVVRIKRAGVYDGEAVTTNIPAHNKTSP
jgi:hypothetical protein